jgi:S-adenosylmethionine:tRNA ribosyltransferase-isomerase
VSVVAAPARHGGGVADGRSRTPNRPGRARSFELPDERVAESPPEARGLARDEVRMLVAYRESGELVDTTFRSLPDVVEPGDLLVVNTSATLPAAVGTVDGRVAHFSTALPDGDGDRWVVELRRRCGAGSLPDDTARPGDRVGLDGGGALTLLRRYPDDGPPRLWVVEAEMAAPVLDYLARHGRPIRYGCTELSWPLEAYQTAFAIDPGSAEMPSAARGFTPELVTRLVAAGVGIAPITLHAGVSSQEAHEPPYEEWYRVPAATAERVNATHDAGHAVIAVGTTPTRALETVADGQARAHPNEGWTDLVVTPARGVRVVDGLLTGWHEPEASHLQLLEAVAGRELLDRSYAAALELGYRWHEFGDLHLIAPGSGTRPGSSRR